MKAITWKRSASGSSLNGRIEGVLLFTIEVYSGGKVVLRAALPVAGTRSDIPIPDEKAGKLLAADLLAEFVEMVTQ